MFKDLHVYHETNIIKVCLYGFISGMSLMLSGNTLNFWLASFSIDAKIIGFFACVSLPYALKYFLALLIDHYKITWLEKRISQHKAWLIFSQSMLTLVLIILSFLNPLQHLLPIAISGFCIALFTVIQYIILNANRIRILTDYQQAVGASMYNAGYRLGMLFSGAGAIFISTYLSWSHIYLSLAVIYFLLTIILWYFYHETEQEEQETLLEENANFLYNPFKNFLSNDHLIWLILFILIYRMADNMLIVMINPFFIQIGYNSEEIASISKLFGTMMVIVGGLLSGQVINKFGIKKCLFSFGMIHMLGHSLFIIHNFIGKNIPFLYFLTAYEAFTGGMVMTAYLSFISSFCKGKYTATQYALLSSIVGLSQVLFSTASGLIVDYYGWSSFFFIITFTAATTTILILFMPKYFYKENYV